MSFQLLHLNNLFIMPVPRGARMELEDDGTVGIVKLDEAKELFLFFGNYTFRNGGRATIETMLLEIDDFMHRSGKVDSSLRTNTVPSTDEDTLVVQSFGRAESGRMWLARIYTTEGSETFLLIHSIASPEDLICDVIPYLTELQLCN